MNLAYNTILFVQVVTVVERLVSGASKKCK